MSGVKRIFVEKRKGFDVEASNLMADLKNNLGLKAIEAVRIINRYDISGLEGESFEAFGGDALTVNGYLGTDGVKPVINVCKDKDKGMFILVKTSNPSSGELQDRSIDDGLTIYRTMGNMCEKWGEELMGEYGYSGVGAVVGATYPEQLGELRKALPHTFFLVPGYGAQGGGAKDVAPAFDENGIGAVINSSRGIMCAWKKEEGLDPKDYAQAARREAIRMRDEINSVKN